MLGDNSYEVLKDEEMNYWKTYKINNKKIKK